MRFRRREDGRLLKNRLKEIREENKLLQRDIAAQVLFMSQTGYSQYETGTNDIPTDVLRKLAKYYDTSIDYLLYQTDVRTAYPKSIFLQSEEVEERINQKI